MRIIVFFLTFAFLASCSSSGNKSGKTGTENVTTEISSENLSQIEFHVTGMTCEGCEKAIVTSINKLGGIQEATASHTGEAVTVVYDSTLTNLRALSHAIEDAGYTVEGTTDNS